MTIQKTMSLVRHQKLRLSLHSPLQCCKSSNASQARVNNNASSFSAQVERIEASFRNHRLCNAVTEHLVRGARLSAA